MNLRKLIAEVPVAPVIERTFTLERSGQNYLKGIEHDSLVIDLRKNRFYWNSVGISGNAFDWLTKVKGKSCRDALMVLQQYSGAPFVRILEEIDKPTQIYSRLLDVFYELGKTHREYWALRGFSNETINHFRLGYSGKAHVIPIIVGGKLANFQCRIGQGDTKRVWMWANHSPDLFNIDAVCGDSVFITEGSTDAIAMHQIGLTAITPNNVNYWLSDWNRYILGLNRIYILYDNDRAGKIGASRLSRKLLNRAYVLFWPKSFPDKFDINKGLLLFGEEELRTLIIDAMLPNAVHSSTLYDYGRKGQLHEFIEDVQNEVGRKCAS